jgi:hypothetical protein
VRDHRQEFILGAGGLLRRSLRPQDLVLILITLAHWHQDAVVGDDALPLTAHSINEHGDFRPSLGTEREIHLFDPVMQFEEREEMCLIEDAAGNRHEGLDVPFEHLAWFAPEQLL